MTKICKTCGRKLPLSEFHRVPHNNFCKDCRNRKLREHYHRKDKKRRQIYSRQYYLDHKEDFCRRAKKWRDANQDRLVRRKRERCQELRLAALVAYGGTECAICEESNAKVLCLDHVKQDGAARRRAGEPDGDVLYLLLKRQGYPVGFRVLCRNCNWRAWREHDRKSWSMMRRNVLMRERRRRYKREVFEAYGGVVCALCEENDIEILSLDHVNGGGMAHLREIGSKGGQSLYAHLRKSGYPHKERYRVLCRNCNWEVRS